MIEAERIKAVPLLMRWQHQDATVRTVVRAVLAHHAVAAIGHLARFEPDVFDELFEECEALIGNDT